MFTTWTAANRIVEKPLHTTFRREFVPVATTDATGAVINWFKSYMLYTRKRVKSYRYVGMDKATAQSCANAMLAKYNRFIPNNWRYDETSNSWTSYTPSANYKQDWTYKQVASVGMVEQMDGGRYEVTVEVDEELEYRYRVALQPTGSQTSRAAWQEQQLTSVWADFEANPDIVTPRFATGTSSGSDFDYDEA